MLKLFGMRSSWNRNVYVKYIIVAYIIINIQLSGRQKGVKPKLVPMFLWSTEVRSASQNSRHCCTTSAIFFLLVLYVFSKLNWGGAARMRRPHAAFVRSSQVTIIHAGLPAGRPAGRQPPYTLRREFLLGSLLVPRWPAIGRCWWFIKGKCCFNSLLSSRTKTSLLKTLA